MAVVGIHTKPDGGSTKLTVKEIGGLVDVKMRLQAVWPDVKVRFPRLSLYICCSYISSLCISFINKTSATIVSS